MAAILRLVGEVDYNAGVEVEGSDYVWRLSSLSCRNPAARLITIVMLSGHSYFTIYLEWRFWFGLCVEMI